MNVMMITSVNKSVGKLPQEKELIPVITHARRHICPEMKHSTTEVDSGFGIADVVFYNFDKNTAKRRKLFGIPRIKSYEILETLSVLNEFKSEKINITQLYNKLPYSPSIFRNKILYFLSNNNIAEIIDNQYLNLKYKYQISLQETTAIEAKISNWKRGLYQAYRYKQYSDYSYLALLKEHINIPKNNIDLFVELNVGLISVDINNNLIETIYKPRKDINIFSKWVKYYANESVLVKNGYLPANN